MGMFLEFKKKSGKRDSDPRPQPWQGCALPTELFPLFPLLYCCNVHFALFNEQNTHFKPYFADF